MIPSNAFSVSVSPVTTGRRRFTTSNRHDVISTISALGTQPLRLALQLVQDQTSDQLGLRLASLRRQRFELAQLALVQLRSHMMQPVLRSPRLLCHQPRFIQQCHRSHPRTGSVSKRKHRFPHGTPELTISMMQRCFRATNARFP